MPQAAVMLRHPKSYRRDAFCRGIERLGYVATEKPEPRPEPRDVLIIWNRTRPYEAAARRYEAAGARVIVAENGYLPIGGEKSFALALNHHNGAGEWFPESVSRYWFDKCGKWRSGDKIVVLEQRGIGEPGVAQPMGWRTRIAKALAITTDRPVVFRPHPGMARNSKPLEDDLAGAWAAVTWGSGAAIKALVDGVPVVHCMREWIGAPAAEFFSSKFEEVGPGDRSLMLARLSWAQWTIDEIESGAAFHHLIRSREGKLK